MRLERARRSLSVPRRALGGCQNPGAHRRGAPSQAAFWIFVMKDAIELHTVRTLALIASASSDVRQRLLTEVQAA